MAIGFAQTVRRSLATWLDADDGIETAVGIGESSIIADDPEALARHNCAMAEAVRRGLVSTIPGGVAQTAQIHLRRGELFDAEADARRGWLLIEDKREAGQFYSWCLAQFLEVLIARGAVQEAAIWCERPTSQSEPATPGRPVGRQPAGAVLVTHPGGSDLLVERSHG